MTTLEGCPFIYLLRMKLVTVNFEFEYLNVNFEKTLAVEIKRILIFHF